jgi:uncharacterized membrane protein
MKRRNLFGLFIGLCAFGMAQEIEVKGAFLEDSLQIGVPVQYWLSAKYPAEIDLFLPDSTYDFAPFEFNKRVFFETKIIGERAYDSVVYSLQSFEIDDVQYLRLPGTVYIKADTLKVFASRDSIFFQDLVPIATDTTAMMVNTDYQKLSGQFNSPLLMIILGVLAVIALIVFIVFGKKIRRHFRLKRMAKAHLQFKDQLENLIANLKASGEPEVAESALSVWKHYQEKIEKQPFSKLTSKEIVAYDFAKELTEPLRAIDRCVYGKMPSKTVYQDFQHLEGFTEIRYNQIVEKIKHGGA